MNEAAQERAGGQHDAARTDFAPVAEDEPTDPPRCIEQQILGRALDDRQTGGLGEQRRHGRAVELPIGLRAGAPHRRPLAAVQHAELDAGAVDRAAHDPVERIDLAHQMALGEPADRRVARHLADRRPVVRQEGRAGAKPRRRRRRLAPGMPPADHHDIVGAARVIHGGGM